MTEWAVAVSDKQALAELEHCFSQGPILNDRSGRSLTEAEVGRLGGLKVEVFAQEHPPPHFRVSYQGDTANYRIADCGQINGGLQRYYRNVRKWHAQHKGLLIIIWNERRPTNCPVGAYRE